MNANDAVAEAVAVADPVAESLATESPAPETSPTHEPVGPEVTAPDTAPEPPESAAPEPMAPEASVPEPRPAADGDGETERGKAKKPRRAVRAKSVGGTKALVVWREGRLHYADENVLVIDLDEAASPEVDVHDVVDRLAELRDATESTGRAETVAALGEIIQEKALS
jgi:hypothetical protein